MSHERARPDWGLWLVAAGAFALVVGLWLWSPWFLHRAYGHGTIEEKGQIGDAYGAINSLFSALSIGGVVVALLLQRSDLKLARREFRAAQEERQQQLELLRTDLDLAQAEIKNATASRETQISLSEQQSEQLAEQHRINVTLDLLPRLQEPVRAAQLLADQSKKPGRPAPATHRHNVVQWVAHYAAALEHIAVLREADAVHLSLLRTSLAPIAFALAEARHVPLHVWGVEHGKAMRKWNAANELLNELFPDQTLQFPDELAAGLPSDQG